PPSAAAVPPTSFLTDVNGKVVWRRAGRARRAALKAAAPDSAQRVAENFLANIPLQKDWTVAGYIAAHDELDPAELIRDLRNRSHAIALPRVAGKGEPLDFRLWEKDAEPVRGAYGLFEAAPEWRATRPGLVLVPLLAFDAGGHRLGYGGGYYDRTLARMRAGAKIVAVGVAFAGQEVAALPNHGHDQRLDWIVTEKGVRAFS
ncbi:MAG: 5-formyltetrahydrofolate cyclo-ligase, partial [Alphaproteobacteria bacterium]